MWKWKSEHLRILKWRFHVNYILGKKMICELFLWVDKNAFFCLSFNPGLPYFEWQKKSDYNVEMQAKMRKH